MFPREAGYNAVAPGEGKHFSWGQRTQGLLLQPICLTCLTIQMDPLPESQSPHLRKKLTEVLPSWDIQDDQFGSDISSAIYIMVLPGSRWVLAKEGSPSIPHAARTRGCPFILHSYQYPKTQLLAETSSLKVNQQKRTAGAQVSSLSLQCLSLSPSLLCFESGSLF